jgi:ABC-type glycerol-3-phosphate transport system substrate-binding protein
MLGARFREEVVIVQPSSDQNNHVACVNERSYSTKADPMLLATSPPTRPTNVAHRRTLTRRGALAAFGLTPLFLAGCANPPGAASPTARSQSVAQPASPQATPVQSPPTPTSAPLGLSLPFVAGATPTPSQPRTVNIGYPGTQAFDMYSTQLGNMSYKIPKERHLKVKPVPIDMNVNGKGPDLVTDIPPRYASAVKSLAGSVAPDLVMTVSWIFPDLAKAGALKDLGELLRGESWFKSDDYLSNALQAGQYRGKQLAVPLNASVEVLMYNQALFKARDLAPPAPGATWDQVVAMAKSLAKAGGDPWGFAVGVGAPSFLSMAWQRGAQVVSEDGTKIQLTEPGTIAGMELLRELIADQKLAPPVVARNPRPSGVPPFAWSLFSQYDLLATISSKQEAMGIGFIGDWGFGFEEGADDRRFAQFPAASKSTVFGLPSLMIGVPVGAPDPAHSVNALRGMIEASAKLGFMPVRKDADNLHKIQGMLQQPEADAISPELATARYLPGDFPYDVLETVAQSFVEPVLLGKMTAQAAAKDAEPLAQAMLTKLQSS